MNGRGFYKKYGKALDVVASVIPSVIMAVPLSFFDSSESRFVVLLRYIFFKKVCESWAANVFIGRSTIIKSPDKLSVGENVSIHAFSYIDAAGSIRIGSNVSIAHSCSMVSFEHTWSDPHTPIKYNKVELKSITVEDDVWLGCSVRVLAGAYIERRVVVAAGAVVKGRLLSGHIYGGVPAKIIGKI